MHTEFTLNGELAALPHFLTSLAIGLLIGLERERSPGSRAGLRTFALVALFGTLAAMLSEEANMPWLLLGGLLIVGLMTIAAYSRAKDDSADPGTTTVAAILVCYGLGAAVWYGNDTLAIMLAIITTVLLYFKTELHGITEKLSRRDLISILQFAVLTFIILPILPDKNYGPYEAIDPYQIWLMVVLISGVSLAGYVALQFIGPRHSAVLGLFGGLVSSVLAGDEIISRRYEIPEFTIVIVKPNADWPTRVARAVLPKSVSRADAVYNIGRATLVVDALRSGDLELLQKVMDDRIHQPYRLKHIAGGMSAYKTAKRFGAAALSGAGPSIISFVAPEKAEQTKAEVMWAFEERGIMTQGLITQPSMMGVHRVS